MLNITLNQPINKHSPKIIQQQQKPQSEIDKNETKTEEAFLPFIKIQHSTSFLNPTKQLATF